MHHGQRCRSGEFNREIAVTDRVQAVLADAVHTQVVGHALAVQRVAGTGQGSGAQRQAVDALARVGHAFGVAAEHLDIGQHVVTKAHRLGHLQMGKAGQDDIHVFFGQGQQCLLQIGQQPADQVNLAAQPQAHIGRHLVVAAAAGVQAFAGIADQSRQARFDVEVHVFEVELPLEMTGFDFSANRGHAVLNRLVVGGTDDALVAQHFGVRQAAGDVGQPQPFVKKYAGGVAFDQVAHRLGEQRRPGLAFVVQLVVKWVVRWGGGGLGGHGAGQRVGRRRKRRQNPVKYGRYPNIIDASGPGTQPRAGATGTRSGF